MNIIMRPDATAEQVEAVVDRVESEGFRAHLVQGAERTVVCMLGSGRPPELPFDSMKGVERTQRISKPFKLASREVHPHDTRITVKGMTIGDGRLGLIAGPCAVESREQLLETAHAVKAAGATGLRGGAFKPRTSPYSFQGMGVEGLKILAEASEATGLPVFTEVMSVQQVQVSEDYADVLQIGARNMQNFDLLKAVGRSRRPVLLKRGMSSTMEELLMSAEYILSEGNSNVILCERGLRTFEKYTRNTVDINAIPVLKALSHLPVILDPSHGVGTWEYVTAVSCAGVAAGADGLVVEVHPRPAEALSDGGQSLKPERFAELVVRTQAIAAVVRRPAPLRPVVSATA